MAMTVVRTPNRKGDTALRIDPNRVIRRDDGSYTSEDPAVAQLIATAIAEVNTCRLSNGMVMLVNTETKEARPLAADFDWRTPLNEEQIVVRNQLMGG